MFCASVRSNSISSNNPWDVFNIDEAARKYFMDSLASSDGFSAPFKKGKPIKLKDIQSNNSQDVDEQPLRKPAVIGTAKGSSTLTFKKRNYQTTVFATRYPPRVDIEEVKNDLEINLKTVTGDDHNIKIEKVETRYASYASFKITCICPNTAAFMNPNIWPEGVLVKWWKAPLP